eukprot:gb/GECH01014683.1/.p1 GENE.gb/GECH01014683.1/~~gb/GECH01014683.1/.p1  ORF type:complete len:105 (+),score=31.15 gb/GECH01014683.1/:1-315(+)
MSTLEEQFLDDAGDIEEDDHDNTSSHRNHDDSYSDEQENPLHESKETHNHTNHDLPSSPAPRRDDELDHAEAFFNGEKLKEHLKAVRIDYNGENKEKESRSRSR